MTYGTSHLLIGGGDYFQGEGQEKILLCKGGGHYMKNKNIGGCVLSTQPDQQKRSQCKNVKKLLVSLTRHFTKSIFLEQLTAMPQFNMQICFFFLFSKQSS